MDNFIKNNNNKLSTPSKGIRINRKILEFPKYMTDEELRHLKKKLKKEIVSIEEINKYINKKNIYDEPKGDLTNEFYQELKSFKNNEEMKKNNILNNNYSNILNNKKIFENKKKFFLSNLNDIIIPYRNCFPHKRIKTFSISEINNNQSYSKYLGLKNKDNKKKQIANIFINDNYLNNSEKNFRKKKDLFLTLYKKNTNKINSTKILLNIKNENEKEKNLTQIKYNDYLYKMKSNIKNVKNINNNRNSLEDKDEENNFNKDYYNSNKTENNKVDNSLNNNRYYNNTEYNIDIKRINDSNINDFNNENNKTPIQHNLNNLNIDYKKIKNLKYNNNNKNLVLDRNYFYKTSRVFNTNKKYFLSSEKDMNKSKNYISNYSASRKRILSTENSLTLKKNKNHFLKEISNINEQLNELKNDIINKKEIDDNDIYKIFEEIKKRTKEDMIVSNILAEKGRIQMQSIKDLFKHMKQKKSFISDLVKQYFTYTKTRFKSSIKKKFLKELKKVDLIEKKEAFMRDLAYKKNYEIRKGVNKLKENDLSEERHIFNKNTDKMKQININNIKNYIKSMNKY